MKLTKLSIKNIVKFNKLTDRRKETFIRNLKTPIDEDSSGGGDYWIRSLSGIASAFKKNDISIIRERINNLEDDLELTDYDRTKTMYERNLKILHNFEDFDYSIIRPDIKHWLSKPKSKSIIIIKGLPIQIIPHHIFSFEEDGFEKVGGIWFVTLLDGLSIDDLGIFNEALFIYLKKHFATDYKIDSKYCIVVDVSIPTIIRYTQIESGDIPALLYKSIDSIKKYI